MCLLSVGSWSVVWTEGGGGGGLFVETGSAPPTPRAASLLLAHPAGVLAGHGPVVGLRGRLVVTQRRLVEHGKSLHRFRGQRLPVGKRGTSAAIIGPGVR